MGVLSTTRRRSPALEATLLLVLGAAACSVEAPAESEFGAQEVGSDAADAGRDVATADARTVTTFDGTWLVWSQLSTCVSLITITQEAISRTLFIAEAEYDEETHFVDETWTACLMELPVVFDLQTFATEALYETSYPVFTTGGFVSSTQTGGGYVSGQMAELWGWDSENRHEDLFPTLGDDPRIGDTDNDGHPGVTLLVGDQCQNYMIQRALTTFQGTFVAPDRIEGLPLSRTETFTIDATTPLCATPYSSRSNDRRSTFTRLRIDGEGNSRDLDSNGDGVVTCDEVTPLLDTLFTRIVADDDNCSY